MNSTEQPNNNEDFDEPGARFKGEWYVKEVIIPAIQDHSLYTDSCDRDENDNLVSRDPVSFVNMLRIKTATELILFVARFEKNYPEYFVRLDEKNNRFNLSVGRKSD